MIIRRIRLLNKAIKTIKNYKKTIYHCTMVNKSQKETDRAFKQRKEKSEKDG